MNAVPMLLQHLAGGGSVAMHEAELANTGGYGLCDEIKMLVSICVFFASARRSD